MRLYPMAAAIILSCALAVHGAGAADAAKADATQRLTLAAAEKLVRAKIFAEKPAMNPEMQFPLKELTPDDVFERLKCQVFQISESVGVLGCATYLIRGQDVRPLGIAIGGSGVMSMCVADLDGDGQPELIYSYSFGSGIHRSHVAIYRPLADNVQEAVVPFAYRDNWVDLFVKKSDDQNVSVEAGTYEHAINRWNKPVALGKLELKVAGDAISLDVKLSDALPENVRAAIWKR